MMTRRTTQLYHITLGPTEFFWGSNGNAANHGMVLLRAFAATQDPKFLAAAQDQLDYLLGRNALNICFVTGFGQRFPLNPHHRISEADDVREPVPGMLAGGPNSGQQDDCVYDSDLPALSYSDTYCSYASNEIAINWNAPLAYLASGLSSIYAQGGSPIRPGLTPKGANKKKGSLPPGIKNKALMDGATLGEEFGPWVDPLGRSLVPSILP
jgi:endoglucanase